MVLEATSEAKEFQGPKVFKHKSGFHGPATGSGEGLKRFTETTAWADPWFQDLSPKLKLFWFFVLANCDCAGVWKVNIRLAEFQTGCEFTGRDLLEAFVGRLEPITGEKWLIVKFVAFQYGELSVNCPAHKPVFRKLEEHRVTLPYRKPIDRLQEEEKEEDKEKDKEKEGAGKMKKRQFAPPTLEEAKAYGLEIEMLGQDVEGWFDHFSSNGWKVGGKTLMVDWKSALRNGKRFAAKSFSNGHGRFKSEADKKRDEYPMSKGPKEWDPMTDPELPK